MTKDEKKDELKNRISMALKDPTLQQGFEIICRELADLQKEVIDLRRDKEDLIFVRNAKADHILELKEQIEKMKFWHNKTEMEVVRDVLTEYINNHESFDIAIFNVRNRLNGRLKNDRRRNGRRIL